MGYPQERPKTVRKLQINKPPCTNPLSPNNCFAFPLLVRCVSSAFPLRSLCFSCGVPLLFLCVSFAFLVSFRCFLCAFPLLFLCVSCASPVCFHCFLCTFPPRGVSVSDACPLLFLSRSSALPLRFLCFPVLLNVSLMETRFQAATNTNFSRVNIFSP